MTEALRDGWRKTVVGDPANETVRMGALASLEQREEVRARVRELAGRGRDRGRQPGEGRGRRRRSREGRVPEPDPAATATSRRAHAEVHEIEAFGPVSTLMPYDTHGGGHRARQARRAAAWSARSSPTTTASRARWCSAWPPTTAGCCSPTATAARSRPATARRCRRWSTAVRAVPAAARRWAASAACCTTCSAPRCRARRRR